MTSCLPVWLSSYKSFLSLISSLLPLTQMCLTQVMSGPPSQWLLSHHSHLPVCPWTPSSRLGTFCRRETHRGSEAKLHSTQLPLGSFWALTHLPSILAKFTVWASQKRSSIPTQQRPTLWNACSIAHWRIVLWPWTWLCSYNSYNMHTHSIPCLPFAGLHFLKPLLDFPTHFHLHSFNSSVVSIDRLAGHS